MKITEVKAREILDSRGTPTVQAVVTLADGSKGKANVPSGASVGKYEALELRDGGERLGGKGVLKAVANVNQSIADMLRGKEILSQEQLDEMLIALDGTEDKSKLGANAILSVSMATARAMAQSQGKELFEYLHKEGTPYYLPTPMMNILNGGAHAGNNVDIQEFMILPVGAKTFREATNMCQEVYLALKSQLKKDGLATGVGDEGGFAPNLAAEEEALDYIMKAIAVAGLEKDFALGLDVASSEWWTGSGYKLPKKGTEYTSEQLADYLVGLTKAYPIVSIEDGMGEEDFEGWAAFTKKLGNIQIVGDDLFVTNPKRIQMGIDKGMANAVLIKLNQIGTVTESERAISLAASAGYNNVVSHRSGETEDSFIADFVVSTCAAQIKTGAPARSERTAKYNRLLEIEDEFGGEYLGLKAIVR